MIRAASGLAQTHACTAGVVQSLTCAPYASNDYRKFEDNLGYKCDGIEHELAVMSLKALGNAGATRSSAQILARCMMNEDLETELRVEAIKGFRRASCDISRDELMTMYRDMTIDSEMRIHAYLQLMKCPSRDVLMTVKQQLQGEEINQVSAAYNVIFATSLRNESIKGAACQLTCK